jgi:ribosome maturation factor RimP
MQAQATIPALLESCVGGFFQPTFFWPIVFFATLDNPLMTWQGAVEKTVIGLGYDLVDTERTAGGLLRVFLDRVAGDPAGEFITVDDCERVTRQLQHVLEVEGCSYERLEVSSPGLDRPLKRAADYARFAGQQVDLTLKLLFKGRKKYRGELQAHGEAWCLVWHDGPVEQALHFELAEVREARLVPVVDFKGRRVGEPVVNAKGRRVPVAKATETATTGSADGVDGGRIQ